MAKVLIDVATLRSARRVLFGDEGRAADRVLLDLDIVALGNLVEAIVFFDEILVPDLGHKNLSTAAAGFGSAVSIRRIGVQQRDSIARAARLWFKHWNNIERLVLLIGGHPLFSIRGSTYEYLVLEAIGAKDKYSSEVIQWVRAIKNLSSSYLKRYVTWHSTDSFQHLHPGDQEGLHEELSETENSVPERPGFSFYSSRDVNQILNDHGVPDIKLGPHPEIPDDDYFLSHPRDGWEAGSEVMTFCANLAWLGFRARTYDLASRILRTSYMPHPLRAKLAGLSQMGDAVAVKPEERKDQLVRVYLNTLDKVFSEGVQELQEVGLSKFFCLSYSPVLPYVLKRAGIKNRVIEVAYEIRESKGPRRIRAYISDMEEALMSGDLKQSLRIKSEVQLLRIALRQDLGIEGPAKPKMVLSFPGMKVDIPDGFIPPGLTKLRTPFHPRIHFLRDVFSDLAEVSSLGALYELLCADSELSRSDRTYGKL